MLPGFGVRARWQLEGRLGVSAHHLGDAAVREAHGGQAFGLFSCSKSTNEMTAMMRTMALNRRAARRSIRRYLRS